MFTHKNDQKWLFWELKSPMDIADHFVTFHIERKNKTNSTNKVRLFSENNINNIANICI